MRDKRPDAPEEMPESSTLGAMSNPEHDLVDAPAAHRPMSWVALIGVLLAFMFLPAIVDVVVLKHTSTGDYPDQDSVNVLLIGQSIALAVVVLTISLARWWPVVLHERLRVRPWVWVVAVAPVVTAVALTDYGRLATAGVTLGLTLLLGTLLIGVSEELMYRGVVLTFLRDRYREVIAAVGTTLIFGLSHITAGPLGVLASAVFGYLLYYMRRVSGGILVPIVVHTVYDFSIFSALTTADPAESGNASFALFLLALVLLLVMIVFHRRAELPAREPEPAQLRP